MLIAQIIIWVLVGYFAIGAIFGLYFVVAKAHIVDPAAKGAGKFFRFLIFFGSALLWPILIGLSFGQPREIIESNRHRTAAGGQK